VTATQPLLYGGQTMTAPLRRVFVRRPCRRTHRCREYGWRSEPDPAALAREHEALCDLLRAAGAEVVVGEPHPENPDSVYAFDPAIVSDAGAILLRPGKPGRRDEVDETERDLAAAGVPTAARLREPACAEGGDTMWLDERTLLVGRGFRTNDAGIDALRAALPGVDVLAFDLPYGNGAGEVLHLLSFLSPLDRDLALVHLPLMPVALYELLRDRGIELVEIAPHEYETLACNVLALAPRVAVAVAGNDETRHRLEAAGVEVRTFAAPELSKGDGGPTCLTRPLLRDVA
jgi:dimethylargininase